MTPVERGGLSPEEQGEGTENFDSVITGIREQLSSKERAAIERSQEEQQERGRKEVQLREQTRPLELEVDRLEAEDKFMQGGRYYYALKGDVEGHRRWLVRDRERIIAQEKVREQIWRMREEAGVRNIGSIPADEARLRQEWDKYDAGSPREANMLRDKHSAGGIWQKAAFFRGHVRAPEEMIEDMRGYRTYMNSKEYRGHEATEEESAITDRVYGFHRVAQGTGLAALESGDTRVAGHALAFAQSIEEMPPEIVAKVKAELAKMDEKKMREFTIAFESSREQPAS